jgi:hypothetical protein
MIIKGSARGQSTADVIRLAQHLQSVENESVQVLEFCGLAARTLPDALEEMRLVTLGTRARHALYHASLNLDRDEAPNLGRSRWLEAVDELELRLGMRGHQRVVVEHVKHGRNHVHVVWCRADASTQKVASDGHNYRKHEECARTLEARWQLKKVTGVHSRPTGTRRPVATATHGDWQAQERTGIQVDRVIAALEEAWAATTNGKAFAAAIAREGLSLAVGRRGVIVVDAAGTPHSLPRRLQRTPAEIRRKLVDLDEKRLPTVDDLKRDAQKNRRSKNMPQSFGATNGQQARGRAPAERARGQPDHWRNLGFDLVEGDGLLLVTLPSGTVLADHGERLVLTCAQEPTDGKAFDFMAAVQNSSAAPGLRRCVRAIGSIRSRSNVRMVRRRCPRLLLCPCLVTLNGGLFPTNLPCRSPPTLHPRLCRRSGHERAKEPQRVPPIVECSSEYGKIRPHMGQESSKYHFGNAQVTGNSWWIDLERQSRGNP